MRDIVIAAAQFEARDGDKDFNLGRIAALAEQAVTRGAEVVSFHECCITGYTFLQELSRDELTALAEPVPGGPSTERLGALAADLGVPLMAGLLEVDGGKLYNTYAVAGPEGFVAKYRKLHAFISPHLSWGDRYVVFELCGIQCGIHYPVPVHLQEAYRHLSLPRGSFPVAERCAEEFVSLPMYPELTRDEIACVAEELKQALARLAGRSSAMGLEAA